MIGILMSALDLDKRRVFSILEQKAKELNSPKEVQEIKISLLTDFYKHGTALLKNEESLDDIFLFIEEQTNRRFVCRGGYDRTYISESLEPDFDDEGIVVNQRDTENYDLIYTVIFDPTIEPIHPKTLLDKSDLYYIIKDGEDFLYEGNILELSKTANYYKLFYILYTIVPDGGQALYEDLIKEVRKRSLIRKNQSDKYVLKYIQDNLTGRQNGFLKKANIPEKLPNGKSLIETIRSIGIYFNNQK